MVPLIEITDEVLKGLNQLKIPYNIKKENVSQSKKDTNDFIYVPSIDLYVAKERTHLGKNWFDCHKLLQQDNQRMLIIPEFIELLKYTKENHKDIYDEITGVKNPRRAEWIDADFKVKNKKLYINYNHVLDLNGNLIPKNSEILDENTLMEDKSPGISLEDYLNSDYTKQGFPNKKVSSEYLYYWYPRSNNNSVVRFDAGSVGAFLYCDGDPSLASPDLGVRAVRRE